MESVRLTGAMDERMTPKYAHKALRMAKLALWEIRRDESGEVIVLVGNDFKDLLGWPEDEFPRRFDEYLAKCVHPDDRVRIDETVRKYLDGGLSGPKEMEMRLFQRRTGEWRWFRALSDTGDPGPDGRPDANFGCIIDIHEARMAQEALRASEAALKLEHRRLDTIIEAAGLMVFDWNLADNTSVISGGVFSKPGDLPDGPRPTTEIWDRVMSRDEQRKLLRAREAVMAGETTAYEVEIQVHRDDGTPYWVLDRGRVAEWDDQGRPARLLGVTLDIDNFKKTAKALADSEMYLKQVIEAANVAVWDLDLASDRLTVNGNYASALGYTEEEVSGSMEKMMERFHPDDIEQMRELLTGIIDGNKTSQRYTLRLRHRSGQYIWVFGMASGMDADASGRPTRVVGTHMDFSEWKELERRQAESLEIISRQKEILERQVAERTHLLNRVQTRVETLVDVPGNRLDLVQKKLREEMRGVRESVDKEGVDAESAFIRSMELAFRFIANEMTWYKAVLDSLPFPTSVFDLTRRWNYLNQPAIEAMGGKGPEEFIGRHYSQVWKNYKDENIVFLDEASGKKTFTRSLGDDERFFQCQSSFLLGEKNRPIGLVETMQDITATHEAEERIQLMLDATPLACSFFGSDGALLDCNLEAAAICGVTDKQEYLDHFYDYTPPALPGGASAEQTLKDAINEAFIKGFAELDLFYLRDRSGRDIPGAVSMKRLQWRNSFIVVGYFRDIRKLLAARERLEREKRFLNEILDCCPFYFSVSRDNIVRYVTPNTRRKLRLDVGDHYDKVADAGELASIRRELDARQGKGVFWHPVTVKTADGGRARFMLTVIDGEYEGGPAAMAWYIDMDDMERRMAEHDRPPGPDAEETA